VNTSTQEKHHKNIIKYLLISNVKSQTKMHCIQMDIHVLYKKIYILFISTSSPNEKLTLFINYLHTSKNVKKH